MPSKLKEKGSKLKEKIKKEIKEFKPKLVMSKIREKGRTGARRGVWSLGGVMLYFLYGWTVLEVTNNIFHKRIK